MRIRCWVAVVVAGVILAAGSAPAQYGWQWQNRLPQGNTLWSVCMLDSSNVYAVGGSDAVLHSSDGGHAWTRWRTGGRELFGVSFTDVLAGAAVGDGGTIVRTEDGGQTWQHQSGPTTDRLNAVQFTSVVTGTAVGANGTIIRTTNHGATWFQQSSTTTNNLSALAFVDFATGVVVGANNTLLYTQDGGQVWTRLETFSPTFNFYGVAMAGADTIMAVGDGGNVAVSSNAGVTWTHSYVGKNVQLQSISLASARIGTAIAVDGSIFRTTNGGLAWTARTNPTPSMLFSVDFCNANNGIVVGEAGATLRTTNGGNLWTALSSGPLQSLRSAARLTSKKILAVGDSGRVMRSTDNGATWTADSVSHTSDWYSVCVSDSVHGWMVGSNGSFGRTTNGGVSWTTARLDSTLDFYTVSFANARIGFAAGRECAAQTTDGGVTWTSLNATFQDFADAVMLDSVTVVAAIYNFLSHAGTVARSTDGGTSWTNAVLPDCLPYALSFRDSLHGLACGASGAVLRTTNGGQKWFRGISGTNQPLFSVAAVDSLHGIAVGDSGVVLRTTNGGVSWVVQASGTVLTLHSAVARDAWDATITGDEGAILHTRTGGRTTPLAPMTDVYDFGSVDVGTRDSTVITVPNRTGHAITIYPTIAGDSDFTVSPDSLVLRADSAGALHVYFQPRHANGKHAVVALAIAAGVEADSIGLLGIGHSAEISVSPGAIDFGNVLVGLSYTDTVFVQNIGNAAFDIDRDSSTADAFSAAPLAATLAPGDSVALVITFTPADTGLVAGSIQLFHTAHGSPASVDVIGRGVLHPLTWSPAELRFLLVVIDSQRTLPLMVRNGSSTAILIDSIICLDHAFTVSGPNAIPPGDSVRFSVTFAPTALDSADFWILLYHNFPSTPDSIHVVGTVRSRTPVIEGTLEPNAFALDVHPNPMDAQCTISFTNPVRQTLSVDVFSVLGERLATVLHGIVEPGSFADRWSTARLRSGSYILRVTTARGVYAHPFIILRQLR